MANPESKRGSRDLRVKVKTARGRKLSSTRWLERQLNDPYVKQAKLDGMRGRAAYKLSEIDDKYKFLSPGVRVVDLGCAPGGWSQVASKRVNSSGVRRNKSVGSVLAIDKNEIEPLPGVTFHVLDFLDENADKKVKTWLNGNANVVLSDMAASSSGHKKTDHLKIIALCETAAYFAFDVLEVGGVFVAKVLAGGAEGNLQKVLKEKFLKVVNFKPKASRADSSEKFVVCQGFRGIN
jgi:23S rRNA (uridine2552-2'-O)-methyltransferase